MVREIFSTNLDYLWNSLIFLMLQKYVSILFKTTYFYFLSIRKRLIIKSLLNMTELFYLAFVCLFYTYIYTYYSEYLCFIWYICLLHLAAFDRAWRKSSKGTFSQTSPNFRHRRNTLKQRKMETSRRWGRYLLDMDHLGTNLHHKPLLLVSKRFSKLNRYYGFTL